MYGCSIHHLSFHPFHICSHFVWHNWGWKKKFYAYALYKFPAWNSMDLMYNINRDTIKVEKSCQFSAPFITYTPTYSPSQSHSSLTISFSARKFVENARVKVNLHIGKVRRLHSCVLPEMCTHREILVYCEVWSCQLLLNLLRILGHFCHALMLEEFAKSIVNCLEASSSAWSLLSHVKMSPSKNSVFYQATQNLTIARVKRGILLRKKWLVLL